MTSALFQGMKHAQLYSKFRPYPPQSVVKSIINYLETKIELEPPFDKAIDIGCGNGQSTVVLSPYFNSVVGLDVSKAQIKFAKELNSLPNIEYKVSDGEKLPASNSSVQLVSFCQSIHWFNPPNKLYKEIKSVLVTNGVIAAYGYWVPIPKTEEEEKNCKIKSLIYDHFHEDVLGQYWDKEKYIIQNHYDDLELPFKDQKRMKFITTNDSSLKDYIGYLSSRSSFQKLLKFEPNRATESLEEVESKMKIILGTAESSDKITFTLHTDYFLVIGHL